MNVRRFFAPTAREALRKLKDELGADAIVLANRSVDGGVEIVALPPDGLALESGAGNTPGAQPWDRPASFAAAPGRNREPAAPSRAAPANPPRASAAAQDRPCGEEDFTVSLSAAVRGRQQPAPAAPWKPFTPPRVNLDDMPAPQPAPRAAAPAAARRDDPFAARRDDPFAAPAASPRGERQAPRGDFQAAAPQASAPARARVAPQGFADAYACGADLGLGGGLADSFAAPRPDSIGGAAAAPPPGRMPGAADPDPHSPVMQELQMLRSILERQLAGFAWGELRRGSPAKTALLTELLDAGFSAQLARKLIEELPESADATAARDLVRAALGRDLLVLGSDADIIDRGGVFALVGPTGVGKTTTTAKLAARCVVRHGAERLALLTTDGYRIGAHEQLRIYGRILGVQVHAVRDAADLRQSLAELRGKHMVLIDTVGMSQRDRMVAEQAAMLMNAGDVRRLLLLPATSRGDTLDEVVAAYAGPGLEGCIVSKVDEAASLAPVLDVLIRHRLRCFYLANGQRVPEDLHLPNRNYLLHRAVRRPDEDSAHRLGDEDVALMMAAGHGPRATQANAHAW